MMSVSGDIRLYKPYRDALDLLREELDFKFDKLQESLNKKRDAGLVNVKSKIKEAYIDSDSGVFLYIIPEEKKIDELYDGEMLREV